jgi:hypothetical protein
VAPKITPNETQIEKLVQIPSVVALIAYVTTVSHAPIRPQQPDVSAKLAHSNSGRMNNYLVASRIGTFLERLLRSFLQHLSLFKQKIN